MSEHQRAAIEAQRFISQRLSQHQDNAERLLDACATHVAWTFSITYSAAQLIAMTVLSEIESGSSQGFIDIDRSTSRMVMLRDTARNSVHMVSAGELLRLVRARGRDSPPAAG